MVNYAYLELYHTKQIIHHHNIFCTVSSIVSFLILSFQCFITDADSSSACLHCLEVGSISNRTGGSTSVTHLIMQIYSLNSVALSPRANYTD
jgi:hypothetical protein